MYKPPSRGNREESSLMTSAEGMKKNTAAIIHKLIEEAPLCAAAAIQRGPSTVAMLKSSTSQKPITRGSCGCAADSDVAVITGGNDSRGSAGFYRPPSSRAAALLPAIPL